MKITHLIPNIDLMAQPRQLEEVKRSQQTIRQALQAIGKDLQVSVKYLTAPEQSLPVPDWATEIQMQRDARATSSYPKTPPLIMAADLIAQVQPDDEFVIYTNPDICLREDFYNAVAQKIRSGATSLNIHRRTISDRDGNMESLENASITLGLPHIGSDCFVFPAANASSFVLDNLACGLSPVDELFMLNLALTDPSFERLREENLTFHFGDAQNWKSDFRAGGFAESFGFGRNALVALASRHSPQQIIDVAATNQLFAQTWIDCILPVLRPGLTDADYHFLGFRLFQRDFTKPFRAIMDYQSGWLGVRRGWYFIRRLLR